MKRWLQVHLATRTILLVAVSLVLVALVTASSLPTVPTASAEQPGDSLALCTLEVQFIGFSDVLNKTNFGEFGVNELSAITYDQHRGVYYSIADRAGAIQTHFFTLDIPVGSDALGVPTVLDAGVLNNDVGVAYNGFTFDGEGIAITRNKGLLVASESGSAVGQQPEIRRFSSEGAELESLEVPSRFLIGTNNLSFESLALSPDGRSLFTANEAPLAADGRTADLESRIRILRYEDRGPGGFVPAEQFYYLTEPGRTVGDLGVADMIALSEADLLVLERGFVAGQGNTVRVFRVSVKGAADVSGELSLAAPGLVPLAKTLLVDLAGCPPSGATIPPGATQPNALLDNFEGMTLGPYLSGGRRALILQSDDNAGTNQTTRLIVLAVSVASLVGQE